MMSQLLEDMACIEMSARVGASYGKTQREAGYRVIDYVRTLEARVAELEKIHAAVCQHLSAMGACNDTGDHDDDSHPEGSGCTYCDLDHVVERMRLADQRGEWES